jgi:hypothetical protein
MRDATATPLTPITHLEAKLWAHLFNVRYQLLMTCLWRTFEYAGDEWQYD